MKGYPHLATKLFASPLMLHAPVRESFQRQLLAIMKTGGVAQMAAPATAADRRVGNVYEKIGPVGLIRFYGVVDKSISSFDMECYGGLDLNDIDSALALAENDPSVDIVVIDFNSPGGSVTGVPETAARVAALRESKEVRARVADQACSAAYYIASQCDRIDVTPSGCVGSIGVYNAILDESKALEMEGVKVEFIKAGRMKGMGASFKELSDEERAFLQANVDRIWADFKAACTTLRNISEDDMQGQWFDGSEAVPRKLADEITTLSLDEYISMLLFR